MLGWWKKRRLEKVERRAFEARMLEQLLLSLPEKLTVLPSVISNRPTALSSLERKQ